MQSRSQVLLSRHASHKGVGSAPPACDALGKPGTSARSQNILILFRFSLILCQWPKKQKLPSCHGKLIHSSSLPRVFVRDGKVFQPLFCVAAQSLLEQEQVDAVTGFIRMHLDASCKTWRDWRSGFPTLGSHWRAAPFLVAQANTASPLLLCESRSRSAARQRDEERNTASW